MKNNSNLIWLDLEMTGLDVEKNRIIEIATLVTDKELNVLAEGPVFAIHQPDDHLALMDKWCTNQHGASGLTERVRQSQVNEREAEVATLDFLKQYVAAGKSPLCGNSVCIDRRFMARYMPELNSFFHYRLLDVSTFKELGLRWAPDVVKAVKKESKHLALDDIKDSIAELQHYRQHLDKFMVVSHS